jgi:hypothetical protein
MATNSEPKRGGNGGGELEKRVTAIDTRVTVIEKTMVTAEVFQRELAAFRDEMRLVIGRLCDEMHVEFGELRTQMQAQGGALRAEIGGLADEMHVGFGELRKEMQVIDGALRVEIAKTPFETFKWLLAAAGLAAAIATTVYNIWFR